MWRLNESRLHRLTRVAREVGVIAPEGVARRRTVLYPYNADMRQGLAAEAHKGVIPAVDPGIALD